MERVARFSARERSELFSESATQKGTTPAIVENDNSAFSSVSAWWHCLNSMH